MTEDRDPFDRLRDELGRAAERKMSAPSPVDSPAPVRRRFPLAGRPLVLAAVGLLAAGSATAAVVVTQSTRDLDAAATTDAPAAQTLRSLNDTLDALPDVAPRAPEGSTGTTPAPTTANGAIRGTTVTRGPVHVDIAVTAKRICLDPRTALAPRGAAGCATLPLSGDRLSLVRGNDPERGWLVAIAPDGVSDVRVETATGASEAAVIDRNIAIAIVPPGQRITRLSWTRADGTQATQQLGAEPDNDTRGAVRSSRP